MANLLHETNFILREHGKSWKDVKFVFNSNGQIPKGRFNDIANQDYDDVYGITEVRQDLIIIGDDWWLERREYDGSEWWEFVTKPEIPADIDYSNGIFVITRKMKVIKGVDNGDIS